jgi:hypothetical protein
LATIVTVHGTFAGGALEGAKWWQRGSPTAARLAEYVEAEGGDLRIEPHVWSGHNSETARRAAGSALADKMAALDAAGEPFVVIGHSHGGSVISAAMLNCAQHRRPLPSMGGWITVGTPFIKTARQRFLFSRLGLFGRAVYLTLLTFLVLGCLSVFVPAMDTEPAALVLAFFTFVTPIAVFYGVLRFQESRRSLRFNKRHIGFAATNYADRWLSLWHGKDEAVQSLKAVKALDFKIFQRDFATSSLNLLAVIVVPLLVLIALNSQTIMDAVAGQLFSVFEPVAAEDLYPSKGANIFENAAVLFLGLVVIPPSFFLPDGAFEHMPDVMQWVMLLIGIAVLVGFALLLTLIFSGIARLASHGLSAVLNPVTLRQLKAVAYGSDTREDLAIDAGIWPVWLTRGYPPLPQPIAGEIERASDAAIGLAIPKFRNLVECLTGADSAEQSSDLLADYLTWRELIHTSYFDDERFTLLLAYAVARLPGFREAPRMLQHPAYGEVVEAYHTVVGAAMNVRPG